jgi:hypothetical protein
MNQSMPWRWLREPLLHFLLLGGLLFALYGALAPASNTAQTIVVSRTLVDDLIAQHQSTWMRPPKPHELDGLIATYVRDEMLYREGLALGLDRDDAVIKRRVRQKLEVITEEQLAATVPDDAALTAYLSANAARFSRPAVLSFEQITLDGSASPARLEQALTAARAALQRGAAAQTLGLRTLLPAQQSQVSLDWVVRDFGQAFADQLVQLPVGEWAGPVASGIGVHLVRVTERTAGGLPPLAAVRTQVAREWQNTQRERSREQHYQALRTRYAVVVEPAPRTAPQP